MPINLNHASAGSVTLASPSSGTVTFTLPSADGTSGQALVTNGSGVLSFATVGGGVTSFNTRTGAVTLSSADVTAALAYTPYNAANPSGYISGNQTITVSGDASGSGTTAISLTLATQAGLSAGTYNNVTVNTKGLVTAASNVSYLTGNQTITVSGDASGSGTTAISLTLANSGVTAGTYTKVTVDAKGRVTTGASIATADLPTSINSSTSITESGTISATTLGFRGIPQNSRTAAYTLALTDAGKHISITTGGVTIPANASVAFPIGTAITIFNNSASTQTIAVTTDTLRQAGTTNTGTRTLAVYGVATILKITSTVWVISGNVT